MPVNYDFLIEIINMILLCILFLWLVLDSMSYFKKQRLMKCIFLTLLVVIAETGCLLTDNTAPQNRGWSILFNCIGFGLTPLVLILESELYTQERRKYPVQYIPAIVNGVFVLLSPILGGIFRVTAANEYQRGEYFEVYMCAFLFSIVYSACMKLTLVRRLPSVLSVKVVLSNAVVLMGALYQVVRPQFHITWLGVSIYFVLVYSFLKEMDGLADRMTGLLNQNVFQLIAAWETRRNRASAVVVFDIDRFKEINDTLGHQQGNVYIRKVAEILRLVFGGRHRAFRTGGDEFAVILSGVSEDEVRRYLKRVEEIIGERRGADARFPTVSYGYAFNGAEGGMERAIKLADERMYACKKEKERMPRSNASVGKECSVEADQ